MARDSESPLSNKRAVMKLAPTLLKMKKQGFGTSDLVRLLHQHRITVQPRDLSRYMREYKNKSNLTSGKKPARYKARPKQAADIKATGSNEAGPDPQKIQPPATDLTSAQTESK